MKVYFYYSVYFLFSTSYTIMNPCNSLQIFHAPNIIITYSRTFTFSFTSGLAILCCVNEKGTFLVCTDQAERVS